MLCELFLFAVISLIAFALYRWMTPDFDYFKKRNIKYMKPSSVFRLHADLFLRRYTAIDFTKLLYQAFPDESIYGFFDSRVPQYVVRDPQAIKLIAVKNFDDFEDHRAFTDENVDKLWGNSLFFMKGEKWRQMRATLSPAFTSSKMRQMFDLIGECANNVVDHFHARIENGQTINIEMKDFFSRYTNDVIASCAFGLKIDSFANPGNEFYVNGRTFMDFTGMKMMLKSIVLNKFPTVGRILRLSLLDRSISDSFKQTILNTMNVREDNNINRPDMINIMMQVRNGMLKHHTDDENIKDKDATVDESEVGGNVTVNQRWNDDEIVAQCFLFFVAGFNTSSTTLTFVSYELTLNPDIQQKLYEEIIDTEKSLGGERITYDVLHKMKYLDQVICETLRKWPPAVQTDRVCVKDHMYNDGHKLKFKVEKGKILHFPIYGIQNDPKYFPEPDKFDPDRFNDKNKGNITPGTYNPWGIGPRNCLGSRFALMEIKAILYHLLLNFSFEPNEKTRTTIEFKKTGFSLLPEHEMHLELKPRTKKK